MIFKIVKRETRAVIFSLPFQRPFAPSTLAIFLYACRVELYLTDDRPLFPACRRTLTTSVGWASNTAKAPVVIPAATRTPMFIDVELLLPVEIKANDEKRRPSREIRLIDRKVEDVGRDRRGLRVDRLSSVHYKCVLHLRFISIRLLNELSLLVRKRTLGFFFRVILVSIYK